MADADSLADSLTAEQWDYWRAIALIDGWYHGWTQSAEILSAINNSTNRIEIATSMDPKNMYRNQKYTSGPEIVKAMNNFDPPKLKHGRPPADAEKLIAARQAAKYGN